jgi:hypothetical protein
MPKRGKLARGRYWARWRIYFRTADGREKIKRREKIIDRSIAQQMGFALDYPGALTKTDARKVLDKLIQQSQGAPASSSAWNRNTTVEQIAREYIELSKPSWGANTQRGSVNLIETHIIGKLGRWRAVEVPEAELQRFLNGYIYANSSKSFLDKLVLSLRAILESAV